MDIQELINHSLAIQAIPAPTFHENQRGTYMLQQFKDLGLTDLERDDLGNIYGRCPSKHQTKALVLSAHLDTVFPIESDLTATQREDKIYGPGIGDNATGLAALLVMANAICDTTWECDVWFVATVREEGNGNLDGMRSVVNRFGEKVRGYIILEGMALGHVVHKALHVQRNRIVVNTPGGHSWIHHDRPSAIHQIMEIGQELLTIPLNSSPRQTLNIGIIQGGTSINTRAASAFCDVDLRAETAAGLHSLEAEFHRVIGEREMGDVG